MQTDKMRLVVALTQLGVPYRCNHDVVVVMPHQWYTQYFWFDNRSQLRNSNIRSFFEKVVAAITEERIYEICVDEAERNK